MNNKITEMKNTLKTHTEINSRITEAEEWISELEDRMMEIISEEKNREKRMQKIESQRLLGQYETHHH